MPECFDNSSEGLVWHSKRKPRPGLKQCESFFWRHFLLLTRKSRVLYRCVSVLMSRKRRKDSEPRCKSGQMFFEDNLIVENEIKLIFDTVFHYKIIKNKNIDTKTEKYDPPLPAPKQRSAEKGRWLSGQAQERRIDKIPTVLLAPVTPPPKEAFTMTKPFY